VGGGYGRWQIFEIGIRVLAQKALEMAVKTFYRGGMSASFYCLSRAPPHALEVPGDLD
jgi:hypothetical protein